VSSEVAKNAVKAENGLQKLFRTNMELGTYEARVLRLYQLIQDEIQKPVADWNTAMLEQLYLEHDHVRACEIKYVVDCYESEAASVRRNLEEVLLQAVKDRMQQESLFQQNLSEIQTERNRLLRLLEQLEREEFDSNLEASPQLEASGLTCIIVFCIDSIIKLI
jgi:CRISPR/Cas system-associated endoribonuclease Cas2